MLQIISILLKYFLIQDLVLFLNVDYQNSFNYFRNSTFNILFLSHHIKFEVDYLIFLIMIFHLNFIFLLSNNPID